VKELLAGFEETRSAVKDLGSRAAKQLGPRRGTTSSSCACDTEQRVWLMLQRAQRNIASRSPRCTWRGQELKHNRALVEPGLACFLAGTEEMATYRRDLDWAQLLRDDQSPA
jgi:tRNA-splicing ligase RtcB